MPARRRRRTIAAAVVTVGASLAVLLPTVSSSAAAATTFHQYAIGFDLNHGPYSGIGVTRNDISVTVGAASDCTTNAFGAPVVYQTEWVNFDNSGQNWEELGTSHRCNHHDFWYWGFGLGGAWYPVGTVNGGYIGPPARHRFSIWRDSTDVWHYQVDSTNMGHDTWNIDGAEISFGLESYDPNASIVGTDYANISFLRNGVSNIPISGRQAVNIGSWMCGEWGSDTTWWAGEGHGCGYVGSPPSAASASSAPISSLSGPTATSALPVTGQVRAGGGISATAVATTCAGGAVKNAVGLGGNSGSVVGAYGSNATAVRDWKSRALGKALAPEQVDAAGPVVACVISGNYAVPAPPLPDGSARTFDLAVVTVGSDGKAKTFAYGNSSTLAGLLARPPVSN